MMVNRRKVKEFALECAKNRHRRFTRVGSAFYILCEANLKELIRNHIQRIPSKGKTIE
jgi:hypothetical protein